MKTLAQKVCALVFFAAGSMAITGCTSTQIDAQVIDQPLSSIFYGTDQPCRGITAIKPEYQLQVGESCWFIVQPSVRYFQPNIDHVQFGNGTGLKINASDVYEVTIPADQFWYDKARRSPAPQGDTGGSITKRLGFIKHHKDVCWFALMATVNHNDEQAKILLKDTNNIISGLNGELSFYVNDASSFYGNNSGRIVVRIKRISTRA